MMASASPLRPSRSDDEHDGDDDDEAPQAAALDVYSQKQVRLLLTYERERCESQGAARLRRALAASDARWGERLEESGAELAAARERLEGCANDLSAARAENTALAAAIESERARAAREATDDAARARKRTDGELEDERAERRRGEQRAAEAAARARAEAEAAAAAADAQIATLTRQATLLRGARAMALSALCPRAPTITNRTAQLPSTK